MNEALLLEPGRPAHAVWHVGRNAGARAGVAYLLGKRLTDLIVTLLALPVVIPVLLLCAVAARIDSPGAVFFAQLRGGVGGRSFRLWKLRTRVPSAADRGNEPEHAPVAGSTAADNPGSMQPTRVGRFLERTKLDEWPQLINVLRGEMSLVGPRPAPFPGSSRPLWHTARLEALPGITGLAQLSGIHKSNVDERSRLDISYIRRRSLAVDFRILLQTFAVMTGVWLQAAAHPFGSAVAVPAQALPRTRPSVVRAAPRARPGVSVPQLGASALAVLDVAAAAFAFALAYAIRFELGASTFAHAPRIEYVKLFLVIGATMAVLARLQQLYRTDNPYSTLEEAYAVAKVVTIATAVGLAITFFYRDFHYSRLALVYFWALAIALTASAHALYRSWLVRRYERGLDRRRTLVVGRPSSHLLERLQGDRAFGVDAIGWIGGSHADDAGGDAVGGQVGVLLQSAKAQDRKAARDLPKLGTVEEAPALIAGSGVEQVVILEHGLSHAQLLETIDACERHGVHVQLVPPIYDLLVQPTDLSFVSGVPTVRIDEARYHRGRHAIKRIFDITASALLLLVVGPLMLGIAWAIRRTSPGPALFRQTRAGQHGRPFEVLKFRTMVADAEQRLAGMIDLDALDEPVFKIVGDPRVTPIGRWLRRFSLDELPQIINVLKGDMSLVGPRPEELKIVERYDIWQRRRLKMKPGITGLQQVVARGALSSLNERVRFDTYYIRKQSLLLDLVILGRTVGVVLSGRGAT
jgi:exopolysaccharide biosynthesis polyprenyl glycosylphosphotransferase